MEETASGRQLDICRERGASMVEVVLIAALIAVVCIPSLSFFGETSATSLRDAGLGIAASRTTMKIDTGDDTFTLLDTDGNTINCWRTACAQAGGAEGGPL